MNPVYLVTVTNDDKPSGPLVVAVEAPGPKDAQEAAARQAFRELRWWKCTASIPVPAEIAEPETANRDMGDET